MENEVRVRAAVVSCGNPAIGTKKESFYLNGLFAGEGNDGNSHGYIECSGSEFLFGIYESMMEVPETDKGSVSIVKELKRLQDKFGRDGTGIETRLGLLDECVELTNSLIYSKAITGVEDLCKKNSFSGLVVHDNRAALLYTGSCSAFLIRNGSIQDLTRYDRKTERLLQLGIISTEKAKQLSKRAGGTGEPITDTGREYDSFNLESGDTVLLCSSELAYALERDRIAALLLEESHVAEAADKLVKAAMENGGRDSVCAMLIQLELEQQPVQVPRRSVETRSAAIRARSEKRPREGNEEFRTYIAAAITCILLAGLIFAAYVFWVNRDGILGTKGPNEPQTTEEQTGGTASEETTTEPVATGETQGNTGDSPAQNETDGETEGAGNEEPIKYIVKAGDSLQRISKRFYNDISKYELIMKYNKIKDPNDIKIGQELQIPPVDGMQRP